MTRDLGVVGLNPGLVCHYFFSNPVIFGASQIPETDRLIPARGRALGDRQGQKSFKGEKCGGQTSSDTCTGAR